MLGSRKLPPHHLSRTSIRTETVVWGHAQHCSPCSGGSPRLPSAGNSAESPTSQPDLSRRILSGDQTQGHDNDDDFDDMPVFTSSASKDPLMHQWWI